MSAGETGAATRTFEHYVLALQWQPQWSFTSCPSNWSPCASLVNATNLLPDNAYAFRGLSLHGLWPEYDQSVGRHGDFQWPEYCDRSDFNYSTCTPRMTGRAAPPIEELRTPCTQVSREVRDAYVVEWQRYALSYAWRDGVAAHEWARHGSCTAWPQLTYFERAEELMASLELGAGASWIRLHAAQAPGGEAEHAPDGEGSAAELRAAFAEDTGAPPRLKCADGCFLSEVWLGVRALPRALTPLMGRGNGVAFRNGSGVDTCASRGCERLTLRRWRGCPPPPPAAPPRPMTPPSPPRGPLWVVADRGVAAASSHVALRASAIVVAAAVLVVFGLRAACRQRPAGVQALPGFSLSDPPSPAKPEEPMPAASASFAASLRCASPAAPCSSPCGRHGMGSAAGVTLSRLIHDEGDEIVD